MRKSKGMLLGALITALLLVSMALVPTINAEPLNKDSVTVKSESCNVENANADLNSMIVIDNKSQIKQQTPISVYELFNVEPHKLPTSLISYKDAKIDAKEEMNSIVNNAGINTKSDEIVGMLKYNGQRIVLIDSNDTVIEIIESEKGETVATYQLKPKLIEHKDIPYKQNNLSMKTAIDLYELGIKIPKKHTGDIEILYTHVITAQNEAWKEIYGCAYCLVSSKDMNVIAKGKFYIDYGNNVETILDLSYTETNCIICISRCSFSSTTTGSGTEIGMVDATAIWAANIAPATADFEISSWVSIDKFGDMDSGASEDSWVTPGFGCYSPP